MHYRRLDIEQHDDLLQRRWRKLYAFFDYR
jgi:hypothetical protein